MLKIRSSRHRLIVNMESPYLRKMIFIFRRGPEHQDTQGIEVTSWRAFCIQFLFYTYALFSVTWAWYEFGAPRCVALDSANQFLADHLPDRKPGKRHSDIIMSAMASQITGISNVCLHIKENIKAPRHWPLWVSNADNVSIWSHHPDLVNTLRPRQEGPQFSRRHFKMHFLEWKYISFD